jgi:hypothetical protein
MSNEARPDRRHRGGMSRRDLIKASALAGAAAWTAPVLIDSLASPAAAGTPACGDCSNGGGGDLLAGAGAGTSMTGWCNPAVPNSPGMIVSDGTAFRPGTNATVGLWYARFVYCFPAACTTRFASSPAVTVTVQADIAQADTAHNSGGLQSGAANTASNKANLNMVLRTGSCPACTTNPPAGSEVGRRTLTTPAYTPTTVYPTFTTWSASINVPTATPPTYLTVVMELGRVNSTTASAIKNLTVKLGAC